MEYKKDIKDAGLIGQLKSNGMIFFGVSASKKCDRLATAIYLVTNFLSDTEPMKSRLRTLSLELVREASVVKNGSRGTETSVLDAIRNNILETLSLIELAFVADLVSEMNFTILKREYKSLLQTIEIKKSSHESFTDAILGDNFFETTPASVFANEVKQSRASTDIPNSKFNIQYSTLNPKGHSIGQTVTTMSDRNTQVSPLKPKASDITPTYARATTDIAKESRRARILKLVKDNREVTIKDISTHFSDLSEKTIQRELVSLVENNVLKKFGERRWSRYSLA